MEWGGLVTGLVGGFCAGGHQTPFGTGLAVVFLLTCVVFLLGALCCLSGSLGCLLGRLGRDGVPSYVGPAVAWSQGNVGPAARWAVARALEYRRD